MSKGDLACFFLLMASTLRQSFDRSQWSMIDRAGGLLLLLVLLFFFLPSPLCRRLCRRRRRRRACSVLPFLC